jgi:predicted nucleic acid-binding protein
MINRSIATETLALAELLAFVDFGTVMLLHSVAHRSENQRNINPDRARKVAAILERGPLAVQAPADFGDRARALRRSGMTTLDALHFAWAEALRADLFVTVDDRLLKQARRLKKPDGPKIVLPGDAIAEIKRWQSV